MTLSHIETHVADAQAHFISQYQDKPNLSAVSAAIMNQAQLFEDALWDVYIGRWLDNVDGGAVGVNLDVLGRIVGQPRAGDSDAIYRLYIRTRIAINRSDGTPEAVIAVAQAFLNGKAFAYRELYPVSEVVDVLDPLDPALAKLLAAFINEARQGGTTSHVHAATNGQDAALMFIGGTTAKHDPVHGFGKTDGSTGGKWIGAF